MNSLDYLQSLEPPLFLSGKSAWIEHIPFASAIIKMLKPATFVELGSHHGDSYLTFCQAVSSLKLATRCFAVDTWQGDEHASHYGEEVFSRLRAVHDPLYNGFSTLLRMTFDQAASSFADNSVDLLHIDGLHTYDAVKHDFNTWHPKLSDKAIVLFHDSNVRERDFGVWKFWAEISQHYPCFEFAHGHGLGVLAIGNKLPIEAKAFFDLDQPERRKVKYYFSSLGGFLSKGQQQLAILAAVKAREVELFEQNAQLTNKIEVLQTSLESTNTQLGSIKIQSQNFEDQLVKRNTEHTRSIELSNELNTLNEEQGNRIRELEIRLQDIISIERVSANQLTLAKNQLLAAYPVDADLPLVDIAASLANSLKKAQSDAEHLAQQNRAVAQSSFWRMTFPLRVAVHQVKQFSGKLGKQPVATGKISKNFEHVPAEHSLNDTQLDPHQVVATPEIVFLKPVYESGNSEAFIGGPSFGFVIRTDSHTFEDTYLTVESIISQNHAELKIWVGISPEIDEKFSVELTKRFLHDKRVRIVVELDGSPQIASAPLLAQLSGDIVASISPGTVLSPNALTVVARELTGPNFNEYWISEISDSKPIMSLNDKAIAQKFGLTINTDSQETKPMINKLSRVVHFWKSNGTTALRSLVFQKLASYSTQKVTSIQTAEREIISSDSLAVTQYRKRFLATGGLNIVNENPIAGPRINVVTDSFGSGHFYGGVGTALLFAVSYANQHNATLRLITRVEKTLSVSISEFLSLYGLKMHKEIEFEYLPPGSHSEIGVSELDQFITTSWWTTASLLNTVDTKKIIYLLQEDERMFYPFGDDRLFASRIMHNPNIRYVINTKLLYDHLSATGLEHLKYSGTWFEPAFPKSVYSWNQRARQKRRFLFYARPNNLRNLYSLGIDVVEKAISTGLLNEQDWDIYFVGKDIPDLLFGKNCKPIRLENLSWSDYASLVGTIDVGLCLMYTPHPSYPPLDLAASGAVVVTNTNGLKTNLDHYSKNIVCAAPNSQDLLKALSSAIALSANSAQRQTNFDNNGLQQNWTESFQQTLNFLK